MRNNVTAFFFIPVIALSLVGCATRQFTELNLNERLQYSQEINQQYHIDSQWWTIYNDVLLNQLVETALENNLDLAKSTIAINQALYQANILGTDLVPSFSSGLRASTSKNIKTSDSSTQSFSGNVSISYEVDLWNKLRDSINAQEWEHKATIEDKQLTQLTLINNVIDSYYQLAYLNDAIIETENNIKNYKKINELTKIQYQYGKVDSNAMTQTSQALLSAENSLLDLQNQQKTTEQTLRNLLNYQPADLLNIQYPDILAITIPDVNLDIPLAVLANRPDLRAAEFRLQKAFKNLNASEKQWYPTITIGGAIDSSSDKFKTTFDVPFTSGNISINLPFLQWNKVKWNIKLSESAYENSLIDFEQSITTALNEVDTYYYLYQKTKTTLANTEKKHQTDLKNSEYYKIRYEYGAAELSDWLSAINTANSSKLTLINTNYQLIKYSNMIYKAMGGRATQATQQAITENYLQTDE